MAIRPGFTTGSPYADFFHCPRCGAAPLAKFDERAILCHECGFKFYFNCGSATAAFLFYQDELILGVRGNPPQQGLLDCPGGFVEFDETAEDCLIREIKEELNLDISAPIYLTSAPNDYFYGGIVYKTTDLYFLTRVEDISQIRAQDDVADFVLIAPEAVDPSKLAFTSAKCALTKLLKWRGASNKI
jgi:ADP-ribose pyrophosphatase YjhB (NUDIX family)